MLDQPAPAHAARSVAELPVSWTAPLSTRGRHIVDADGNRFKLQSANWHGSSGTWTGSGDDEDPANNFAQETGHRAPLGLDRAPIDTLMLDFRSLGINSIRLPFSNEMIRDRRPITGLTANPRFNGLTPLQAYDLIVETLTKSGFAVILNNHTTTTRWCCGLDGNERWNSGQSTETFVDDWVFMAERYRDNKRVVGVDLRNEVRRDTWNNPNWGWGDGHDWAAAAQEAGERIQLEANPDLLIIIEGINWMGIPSDLFWHDRPHLKPVKDLSHTFPVSHKLVYAVHFYGYTGPQHTGATGPGETHDARYRELSRTDLFAEYDKAAGYVADTPDRHYTAPIWLSEFGVGKEATDQDKTWFANTVDWLIEHDANFAYWPMIGFQEDDKGNTWGLLRYSTTGAVRKVFDADDWRGPYWKRLIAAKGLSGKVAPVRTWSQLRAKHRDHIASVRVRAAGDWDPGKRKAVCPDDQRLVGITHFDHYALCTDAGAANLWQSGPTTKVTSEDATEDWASGFTKYQCPAGQFVIGYALSGNAVSSVLCAPARLPLAGAGRTVWDDRHDNRPPSGEGGDWAIGNTKAQCESDEYAAGIAFSYRTGRHGTPDALYCRKLP